MNEGGTKASITQMERRRFFLFFYSVKRLIGWGKKKKNADQSCARMKNPGAVSRGRLQTQRHQSDITLRVCPIGGGALKGEERGGFPPTKRTTPQRRSTVRCPLAANWSLCAHHPLISRDWPMASAGWSLECHRPVFP